jgi:hypothetical protein
VGLSADGRWLPAAVLQPGPAEGLAAEAFAAMAEPFVSSPKGGFPKIFRQSQAPCDLAPHGDFLVTGFAEPGRAVVVSV